MKKLFPLLAAAFLTLSACSQPAAPGQAQTPPPPDKKPSLMASFYPLAYLAERIAGESAEVTNLTPAGSEPHDYEPSPQQRIAMEAADLLIVQGAGLEPWAEGLEEGDTSSGPRLLNISSRLESSLSKEEEPKEGLGEDHEEGHDHGTYDPHTWLDPVLMAEAAQAIESELVALDPGHAEAYRTNAKNLRDDLKALDNAYRQGLSDCRLKTFITSHDAFGYLARRYGLEAIGVAGFSPEDEPSAKLIAELSDLSREKGIKHIFTEALANPAAAQTLSEEAGLAALVLDTAEGLTDATKNEDYISLMRKNLESLRTGLQCQ